VVRPESFGRNKPQEQWCFTPILAVAAPTKLAPGIAGDLTWTNPRLAQEVRDSCFEL